MRAEMQTESTWDHDYWVKHPGDNGQSFGISQIQVTVHPGFISNRPVMAARPRTR